jgi:hypothetical protein
MTKAELIDALREYPDDSLVVIEVHDTTLSEDLYDFTLDAVDMLRPSAECPIENKYELRLCAVNHKKNNSDPLDSWT